jgi:hypothetical protein
MLAQSMMDAAAPVAKDAPFAARKTVLVPVWLFEFPLVGPHTLWNASW